MIPPDCRVIGEFERNTASLKGKTGLRICQLGVYMGDTTMWLVSNLMGENSLLYDVDPWVEYEDFELGKVASAQIEYRERRQLLKWGDAGVCPYQMTSRQFFREHPRLTFDLVYVDANHRADAVLEDGVDAWRHLAHGGILAFDDYYWPEAPKEPTKAPKLAIDSFLAVYAGQYELLEKDVQVWLRKL